MIVQFNIPGRPTAWQRTVGRNGVKFTPKDMRSAQKLIGQLCRIAMGSTPPLTGALRLEVLCVYAIPPSWTKAKQECARAGKLWKTTVPDHDNLGKQISDALNEIGYGDDAQIVMSSVGKRYGSPERTEVRLTRLDVLCDHSPKAAYSGMVATLAGQTSLLPPPSQACDTQRNGQVAGG